MDIEKETRAFAKRLIAIFEKATEEDGYCKFFEPNIEIIFNVDNQGVGEWHCKIYSYVVEYTRMGGRHHNFRAKKFEYLHKLVDSAIKEKEKFYGIGN